MRSVAALPSLAGSPIVVTTQRSLTVHRRKLLTSDAHGRGRPVYAASFIRKREIVLEHALLSDPTNLRLILVHEIFHFVWPRLGNHARSKFRALLEREIYAGARGELGESSLVQKLVLKRDGEMATEYRWREYVCESFCDSAAWRFAGVSKTRVWTLAKRWQRGRREWFEEVFSIPRSC